MVRYADGPTATETVDIAAPAASIWPLISDPSVPSRFSGELEAAEFAEPGEPGVGSVIVGTNQHPARGTWTTTSTVTECEPDRCFAWAVRDVENPGATWTFELEAQPDGATTRLTFRATMGPGPSGVLGYIDERPDAEEAIIAARLETWHQNMKATIGGIKDLAEAG